MSVLAVPGWFVDRARRTPLWLTIPIAGVLAIVVVYLLSAKGTTATIIPPGQLYTIVPMDLPVVVKKDGELQAINNIDITCQVEGTTTITQVVKEGVAVKKGDVLMTLDSAQITQKLEDATLDLQKAEADLSSAKEQLEIQISKNAADLETAEVGLELAQMDYKQYAEGSYPQLLANAQTELKMAQITLQNREEDLEQTRKLYAKDFVTGADMKKAELDAVTARNAVAKADTALKVLTTYAYPMDLTSKKNARKQAEQNVLRTKRQNVSQLSWRTDDVTSKGQALNVIKRRYDRLKEQLAATKIVAPDDGIVIYGTTGDRNTQNPIQEGATVRERQLLIRLPDTSAMKAVVRIHESIVPKMRVDQEAIVRVVGVPRPVRAKLARISPVADSSNRFWNPDLREYPVDLDLQDTPKDLKPGMGAAVEIQVDRRDSVTAIPLDAVYAAGEQRYTFIYDRGQIKPQAVTVGLNNDTHVEITDGLAEGQQVIRLQAGQGRELLEKAGIEVAPTTQPSNGRGGKRRNAQPAPSAAPEAAKAAAN